MKKLIAISLVMASLFTLTSSLLCRATEETQETKIEVSTDINPKNEKDLQNNKNQSTYEQNQKSKTLENNDANDDYVYQNEWAKSSAKERVLLVCKSVGYTAAIFAWFYGIKYLLGNLSYDSVVAFSLGFITANFTSIIANFNSNRLANSNHIK